MCKPVVTIGVKWISIPNAHNEYCGRGSVLGNPYPITETDSRDAVCDRFEDYYKSVANCKGHPIRLKLLELLNVLASGKSVNLQCFCAHKGYRCHCETIKKSLERAYSTLSANSAEVVRLPISSPYTAKDQTKADVANKFIGRGSSRSSTAAYAQAYGARANCGKYTANDVIFVSVEGNRAGRLSLDVHEVMLAVNARASFIADNAANRSRSYNVGERELAQLLTSLGYSCQEFSTFARWTI